LEERHVRVRVALAALVADVAALDVDYRVVRMGWDFGACGILRFGGFCDRRLEIDGVKTYGGGSSLQTF
jgi:hypothetical protein